MNEQGDWCDACSEDPDVVAAKAMSVERERELARERQRRRRARRDAEGGTEA